ncbi:NADH dehydrogenase (ubiquinone) B14.7 subunit [Arctopsyche grandis]|uniref:NADH dehydrogenase (ubiquinone) B14.7 subunit n=1 Tax=Arctopsyche grandis TaxID=121162 RepID=UPI00406D9DE7
MDRRTELGAKLESPSFFVRMLMGTAGHLPYVPSNRYHYFDTPGGEDLAKKIWCIAPHASVLSGLVGLHDVVMIRKPPTLAAGIARMMFWMGPPIGVTAAFCAGTYFACNIRKKDDELSHFIGGVCAGPMIGAWRGCVFSGVLASIILGSIALTCKHFNVNDFSWSHDVPVISGSVRSCKHDFSIISQRERNWTTNPEEA